MNLIAPSSESDYLNIIRIRALLNKFYLLRTFLTKLIAGVDQSSPPSHVDILVAELFQYQSGIQAREEQLESSTSQ